NSQVLLGQTDPTLRRYVAAVSLVGTGGAVLVVALMPGAVDLSLVALILVAATVAADFVPIRVPRRGFTEEVTSSSTFAFALLLSHGLPMALIALLLASAASDRRQGKAFARLAFNVGQCSLTILAAGAVLALLSDVPASAGPSFAPGDIPAIAASAMTLFACNNVLVSIVSALNQGIPVRAHIRHDAPFQAPVALLLLGMAPVVVVMSDSAPWLLPLLLLPMVAVHRSGLATARDLHRTLHDDLTGLPNRRQLSLRAEVALQTATAEGGAVAFFMVDLDRFKDINDTLGRHQGDELLRLVAARLAGLMRPEEITARFGGDEFAVVCPLASPAHVLSVTDRLLEVFKQPFALDELQISLDASVGAALWPEHGADADALLRRADVALYQAKDSPLEVVLYDAAHDGAGLDRLALLRELRCGLDRGELTLAYMPKVALDKGLVLGMEALVRWQHPQRGLLAPGAFIPHAEGTGLIGALTLEVLDQALTQAAIWAAAGTPTRMAVNLSARNLLDRGLPETVSRRLAERGVPADLLELEITESAIMADPARALGVLEGLAEMGVHLTIDDFGTGYSSLAYLKRLPVTTLKIDRSFVTAMLCDEHDALIVQSTIDLARNLGLEVVAEGIEDDATRLELAGLGCHAGQGFLFGPPAAADALKTPPGRRAVRN
ncbi:MAG: bifunctional diguanylate cyclase/phosphodiesterase, partial [Solirubrobacteraceae bacterium]